MVDKPDDAEDGDDDPVIRRFKYVPVFDVGQTDREELPPVGMATSARVIWPWASLSAPVTPGAAAVRRPCRTAALTSPVYPADRS